MAHTNAGSPIVTKIVCPVASVQQFPIGELSDKGLLLQAACAISRLSAEFSAPLLAAGVDLSSFKTLVLMGQAGSLLFDEVVSVRLPDPNPFDSVSVGLVQEWFEANAPAARFEIVFPGPATLNLGKLAQLCGWGSPSPLGLTIHPDYGLWVAHRVAFLTDLEWDSVEPARPHPCDACVSRPCESACPASVVSLESGFDVRACAEHRSPFGSECEFQCFARNACPVGAEYRYGPVQMKHHYSSGLTSIREWLL